MTLFSNDIGFNSINLNYVSLNDYNFGDYDPETINHIRLMAWYNKFKLPKACKKEISKELMPVAWHSTIWWDWCMSKDDKKEIKPFFIDEN